MDENENTDPNKNLVYDEFDKNIHMEEELKASQSKENLITAQLGNYL